jgi:hypothetical protein
LNLKHWFWKYNFTARFTFANEELPQEFCTIEEFQNCLKLLQSVGAGESDLALPVNEDELEQACMWAIIFN